MKCLCCGKEVPQTPKKRVKQFCNSTCRSNYWQKEKRKGFIGVLPAIKKKEKEKGRPHNQYESANEVPPSLLIPKNLLELKALCPFKENGVERSAWIATERQKYKI